MVRAIASAGHKWRLLVLECAGARASFCDSGAGRRLGLWALVDPIGSAPVNLAELVQYYEDDLLGAVPFTDAGAAVHSKPARAANIKLLIKLKPGHARELREAIAQDINQPQPEARQNDKFNRAKFNS